MRKCYVDIANVESWHWLWAIISHKCGVNDDALPRRSLY